MNDNLDHQDDAKTQLASLHLEIIAYILELTGDTQSILHARLASSLLRNAGSFAVYSLKIVDGYLPAAVLQTFPRATRFLVRLGGIPASVYLHNVLQLLSELPERTASINICADDEVGFLIDYSTQIAQRVVAAACHSNIQEFSLGPCITTAAADVILGGLSSLQHASLKLCSTGTVWRLSADLSKLAGSLSLSWYPSPNSKLDLAGLRTASKLQALSLVLADSSIAGIVNLAAISRLTALQSLRLISSGQYALSGLEVQAFTALQQLRRLEAPQSEWPAVSWAALASLPSLRDISVGSIDIDAAAPAAAATSITCRSALQLEHTAEQLLGCLATQLPQLQGSTGSTSTPRL